MIEPEMSFCDLECNMQVVEDMIKHLVQACLRGLRRNAIFQRSL